VAGNAGSFGSENFLSLGLERELAHKPQTDRRDHRADGEPDDLKPGGLPEPQRGRRGGRRSQPGFGAVLLPGKLPKGRDYRGGRPAVIRMFTFLPTAL